MSNLPVKKKSLVNRQHVKKTLTPGTKLGDRSRGILREHTRKVNGKKITVNPGVKKTIVKKPSQEGIRYGNVAAIMFRTMTGPEPLPGYIQDLIIQDRLVQLMNRPQEFNNYATELEVLGYLYTNSQSLDRDFLAIYKYLIIKLLDKIEPAKKLSKKQKNDLIELRKSIRKAQWQEFDNVIM